MKVQTNLKAGQVTISIDGNQTVTVEPTNNVTFSGNTITSTSTPAEG
jgi:hypothetical protein